jgi:hypothetical protein
MAFDQSETTFVFETAAGTVELYTTDRRMWLRAIRRNPNFIEARELMPGYVLLYHSAQVKSPEMLLKPAPGGDEVQKRYMTQREIDSRAAAGLRLVAQKVTVAHEPE